MKTYRFSVGTNGNLICIKTDKTIKKYTGKKAIELLDYVKNFSFHTFNSILKNENNNKYFNMEFISNNHSVTYVNINRFQTKARDITIENELKDVMRIVKMNNIAKEREQLKQKRLLLESLNKVKAVLVGGAIGATLTYTAYNAPSALSEPFKVEKVLEYDSSLSSNQEIDENMINKINDELNINPTSPEVIIPKKNIINANSKTYTRLHLEELEKVKAYKEELKRIQEEEEKNKWNGPTLTKSMGVLYDTPTGGMETYYDADNFNPIGMNGVISTMRSKGYSKEEYPYYIREDGVRMLGDYVMVAANLRTYPRGSIVETSLGTAIVCDACGSAETHVKQLDIAVNWSKNIWK